MIKFIIPVLVVIALSVAAFFICGDKIGEIIYPTPAAPVVETPAAPVPAKK
jgi:hypothetical protein